ESAIEESIRSGGISVVKAHRIKQVLERVRVTMGGWTLAPLRGRSAPEVMEYLTALPGVGVKTAAVVALFSLGIPLFPVDTHVFRISVRLGLVPPGTRPLDAFLLLDALVPNGLKPRLHLNLLQHGRRICVARRPRCPICPLNPICPKIGVFP
ncbi:MAG: endonuclease III domain-containing protein, partial [Candidatus Geothermincolia bacterium]